MCSGRQMVPWPETEIERKKEEGYFVFQSKQRTTLWASESVHTTCIHNTETAHYS